MMRYILVLIFTLFSAGTVLGQTNAVLSGTILQTGEPMAGATITLVNKANPRATFTATSDAEGKYRIENVPPGRYILRASSNGGFEAANEFDLAAADNHIADLTLEPSIRESVTISADANQLDEQVSKTVNIIDAQEMRDRADITLVDTVRTIPGFRVQQLGGFGRTASIKARGLRNQDTAVLIDGIRFRDPGSITGDATPFLSDFTLTSIERIEVLRGSGSSLYGTNAVGGTIDFQTPTPRSGLHGQVSGAAGGLGLGRFRGNISYGAPDNKFGISGAVSRTAYTEGIDGNDNATNTNFQSRIEFNPTGNTNLSGRFFVSTAKVRLNYSPDTLNTPPSTANIIDAEPGVTFTPDADDPDSLQNGRFFSGQFSATHVVNGDVVLSGYYQGLVTRRRNEDGPLGPGDFQSAFTSSFGGDIHTANVHATWTPGSFSTVTAGYEFEVENFRNSGSSAIDTFSTRASQKSNTIYAQYLAGLLDGRLQLAAGARAQWFSLGYPDFSSPLNPYDDFVLSNPPAAYTFDGSASYFIARTGTKVRTHVGNGYRVPSLYERFGTFFFSGLFFVQGSPDLKPERSVGIDAGIDQYFAGRKVKASATYFYTKIKDEITYLPTHFGEPVYYNFDRHYSRGAEFSLDLKPTTVTDIFTSYTFTNSDIRNYRRPTLGTLASIDRDAFGIPDHQFTLVVTQRIKRFWVSADVLATSSYLAPVFSNSTFSQYTYRFGGNRRVDLTAGYTFPVRNDKFRLRLFGTIENLFDHEYFENGFRTAGINGRVGLSFGF
jgi:vitamin B12 transporter